MCKRCLAREQADRPADGNAVAQEVAAIRQAAEERARQAELEKAQALVRAAEQHKRRRLVVVVREAEQAKRRRLALVLGGAVAAVLVVGLAVSLWQMRRALDAEKQATAHAEQAEQNAAQARAERDEKEKEQQRAEAALAAETKARAAERQARDQALAALRHAAAAPARAAVWPVSVGVLQTGAPAVPKVADLSSSRNEAAPSPAHPSGHRLRPTNRIPSGETGRNLHGQPGPVKVYGMRKFPYPYKAMLAISSDADHETLRKFNLIHEFLNTTAPTPFGKGLGLDISDSFFLYNGSNLTHPIDYANVPIRDEFTYFRGVSDKPYFASVIDRYIHCGWIDTMHTFGDFSRQDASQTLFNRRLAVQGIQALKRAHDFVTVWTDHGNESNVDNFGAYGTRRFYDYQQGGNPKSPYHVTDLLIPYGIRFVWADQPSDVFGHDSIIYPLRLPDGRRVWGFWRYTNSGYLRNGLPEWNWTVDDLASQLTIGNLLHLEWWHQYAIIAQHLCADNERNPLPQNAISALRLLARQYHEGNILVARTSRLLQYNVTQKYLRYYVTHDGDKAVIHLTWIDDPVLGRHAVTLADIRGVTFYTSDPERTQIDIWNTPLNPKLIQDNRSDGVAPSVEVKWYPPDTRNYADWGIPGPAHKGRV
ncbi:hypothetical protein [Alicyclobacillus sp.]|uniref:hypothetical protein n=1 Tax=Alicyclobacillus sp. TaxID=61169 RepID=UPI0025BBC18C|nr:hypothetical protein [Alicyclobacillus sp.]